MQPSALTRRDFIKANATTAGAVFAGMGGLQAIEDPILGDIPPLVDVDFRAVIARSDLLYLSPVEDPTQGQPIGNGRMGTMVWTTPDSIQFQINRVDVFAVNQDHRGRFMLTADPNNDDLCGACAGITINVGGQPFAKGEHFQQHLALYDAESTIQGNGVQVRCFISAVSDVLVVEIDDQRPASAQPPAPLTLTLSLWGEKVHQSGEHVSSFDFVQSGDLYSATQKFTERGYYCGSAVTVQAGEGHMTPQKVTDTGRTFVIPRGISGKTRILIASAAAMDPKVDLVAHTATVLDAAAKQSFDALQHAHRAWWAGFWSRTFVYISSSDGVADFMEQLQALHLYIMASSSRGKIPPKWNDMLWSTIDGARTFGAQYWTWCMEALYLPLFAAGAFDVAGPYFNMFVAQLPKGRIAATQRWNAKGAFFPEVMAFDGPMVFPDDVAHEFRALLIGLPKQGPLSAQARAMLQYEITLCDLPQDSTATPRSYTQASHIWTVGAKICMHAWWRYRCSGDVAWLRTHGYPLLRDSSEFYRSMATKRTDGKYHIESSNVFESYLGVNDGITNLAAIRGIVPLAIRSAEILKVDRDLCTQWREFLANLAPYPMGSDPESKALNGSVLADDVWAIAHVGDASNVVGVDVEALLTPLYPFEVYTMETNDRETTRIINKLMDLMPPYQACLAGTFSSQSANRTPIYVARLGRGDELPKVLSGYYRAFSNPLPNGLNPFELGALSAEHLGVISTTVQEALMQSLSPAPGEAEIIRVFPAWPKNWEGSFSLVARGGFLVTSTMKDGVIPFVEITSRRGETCQIHNPWNAPCFLTENGKKKRAQSGDILKFKTKAGAKYQLFPGEFPAPIRIAPTRTTQALLSSKRADGTVVEDRLGRAR